MDEVLLPMFLDPDKPVEKHEGNLPHWQQGETGVFLTWRLADSLPGSVVARLKTEREKWLLSHLKPWDLDTEKDHHRLFTLAFETLLDKAHGSCILREPSVRNLVTDALLHFDGDRYHLDSFVVMPNHVHVLFQPLGRNELHRIVQSWKRFSAREINKVLNQTGTVWQSEYWDRLIRSDKHLHWTRNYIANNPKNLPEGSYHLWRRDL